MIIWSHGFWREIWHFVKKKKKKSWKLFIFFNKVSDFSFYKNGNNWGKINFQCLRLLDLSVFVQNIIWSIFLYSWAPRIRICDLRVAGQTLFCCASQKPQFGYLSISQNLLWYNTIFDHISINIYTVLQWCTRFKRFIKSFIFIISNDIRSHSIQIRFEQSLANVLKEDGHPCGLC